MTDQDGTIKDALDTAIAITQIIKDRHWCKLVWDAQTGWHCSTCEWSHADGCILKTASRKYKTALRRLRQKEARP